MEEESGGNNLMERERERERKGECQYGSCIAARSIGGREGK